MISVFKNLGAWGVLELREGWKTWFREVEFKSVQNQPEGAEEERISGATGEAEPEPSPARSTLDCVTDAKNG